MPVITRNQLKNSISNTPVVNLMKDVVPIRQCVKSTNTIPSPIIDQKSLFISEMKELLRLCELTEGKDKKMEIATKTFELTNSKLLDLVSHYGLNSWITFIATAYNKTAQFYTERDFGNWKDIDKNNIEKLCSALEKFRNMFTNIIKNYDGPIIHSHISEAKREIIRLEILNLGSARPRRNIQRVDYTGMDSIEPVCKYDGITNIWAVLSVEEDPDYIYEEDEEDEEEYFDDDYKCKYSVIHPELSDKEKLELKQHLKQLEGTRRSQRNIARVNYAGMDMNEDDQGDIKISKIRMDDGELIRYWISVPLSQVNEFEDKDYVDEE